MKYPILKCILLFIPFSSLGANTNAMSLEQSLMDADSPRMASYLFSLCTSIDTYKLAYCEGYIDGTTHNWKSTTACNSSLRNDQSFCAGVNAAKNRIQEVYEGRQDRGTDELQSELKDNAVRGKLLTEKMQTFRIELKAALSVCSPDEQRDEYYCLGYNSESANELAELSVFEPPLSPEAARILGLSDAWGDVGVHIFASGEFYELQPCVEVMTSPNEVRRILLEFIRDNPEQQRDATATMILAKALYYSVCPGPAQKLQSHMEQCTTWGYDDGQFGTVNTCEEAVVVQFLAKGQPLIERQLNPGEALRTGLTRSQIDGWWFTTCPVGYVSSVPFLPENFLKLGASRYSCIKK